MNKFMTLILLLSSFQIMANDSLLGTYQGDENECSVRIEVSKYNPENVDVIFESGESHGVVRAILTTDDLEQIDSNKISFDKRYIGSDDGLLNYYQSFSLNLNDDLSANRIKISIWKQFGGVKVPFSTEKVYCTNLVKIN